MLSRAMGLLCFLVTIRAGYLGLVPPDKALYCSACELSVEKLAQKLQEDAVRGKPSEARGHKSTRKQISLSPRSETRITEILDGICVHEVLSMNMTTVAKLTEGKDHEIWRFIHDTEVEEQKDKEGEDKTYLKVFSMGGQIREKLVQLCNTILGTYEDRIIEYLADNWSEDLQLRTKVCVEISGVCPIERTTRDAENGAPKLKGWGKAKHISKNLRATDREL